MTQKKLQQNHSQRFCIQQLFKNNIHKIGKNRISDSGAISVGTLMKLNRWYTNNAFRWRHLADKIYNGESKHENSYYCNFRDIRWCNYTILICANLITTDKVL